MKEPILVVLAAGMGSRYGGLKQIDPIGPNNEVILNYTCFDAIRAGFKRFVFIIKEEMAQDFKQIVTDNLSGVEVHFVYQSFADVPASITLNPERSKPLGTTHALYCCREVIDAPFAILNADDFYGASGFAQLYQFLTTNTDDTQHCMIGYRLQNTLTDHGSVARGLCIVEAGQLTRIDERTKIARVDGGVAYEENDAWVSVDPNTNVSMNMWGFKMSMLDLVVARFEGDLQAQLAKDAMKGETLIPVFVGTLLENNETKVEVLESKDTWFGVTYQEDKPFVKQSIQALIASGAYPKTLF
ncbi:MAG: sugar phosphate nucleotidyltransferase [Erysipelotrichaceae bacterium]